MSAPNSRLDVAFVIWVVINFCWSVYYTLRVMRTCYYNYVFLGILVVSLHEVESITVCQKNLMHNNLIVIAHNTKVFVFLFIFFFFGYIGDECDHAVYTEDCRLVEDSSQHSPVVKVTQA